MIHMNIIHCNIRSLYANHDEFPALLSVISVALLSVALLSVVLNLTFYVSLKVG